MHSAILQKILHKNESLPRSNIMTPMARVQRLEQLFNLSIRSVELGRRAAFASNDDVALASWLPTDMNSKDREAAREICKKVKAKIYGSHVLDEVEVRRFFRLVRDPSSCTMDRLTELASLVQKRKAKSDTTSAVPPYKLN